MASAIALVCLGKLHETISEVDVVSTHPHHSPSLSESNGRHRKIQWLSSGGPTGSFLMRTVLSRREMTIDANLSGWGATLDGMAGRGT